MREIHFYPASNSAPLDESEFASLRKMLALDFPGIAYDPDYEAFVRANAGGKPIERYFSTSSGTYPIDHFLNFQTCGSPADPFAFLNTNAVWSAIEDRLTTMQFPFASLPGGDFLCFDYSNGTRPSVVLWFHERSEEGSPALEHVASNFLEFLKGLRSEA